MGRRGCIDAPSLREAVPAPTVLPRCTRCALSTPADPPAASCPTPRRCISQVAFADTAEAEGRVEDSDLALTAAGLDSSGVEQSSEDQLLAGVAAGTLAAAVTGRGFEKVTGGPVDGLLVATGKQGCSLPV